MPEPPPPGVAEDAPGRPAEALTPDAVAAVLADFRNWLTAAAESSAGVIAPPGADAPGSPALDFHTLLSQFVALRHEVNLQTRAARHQQEHGAEALRQLSQALDALEQAQARAQQGQQQAVEEGLRPLLKTLVDLYDSLSLAAREVRRMQENILPVLDRLAPPPGPAGAPPRRSFWSRWFGPPAPEPPRQPGPAPEAERDREVRESAGRVRQWLVSLITGYTMSLQRVERALRRHGLEALHVVGQTFDPETMEVVEAVFDSGRPSGAVVEEVRRGYLWNGRVFRYAQVRVAKS